MAEWGWGLFRPGVLPSQRRTRTLQLSSAVQKFNELAVPGLGNVWFGKQLFLALLGIAVVERVREQKPAVKLTNIETANAVEALACLYAIQAGERDSPKISGKRKLQGLTGVPAFSKARKRGFYVSTPMRMSTSQPLAALGLVQQTGERFNCFTLSERGQAFVEACCKEHEPCWHRRGVIDLLEDWVTSDKLPPGDSKLRNALRPDLPLSREGASILRECLESGPGSERRKAVFGLARQPWTNWEQPPPGLDKEHCNDLYVGSRFFLARDAALEALDSVERGMGNGRNPLPLAEAAILAEEYLTTLRDRALEFLNAYRGQHEEAELFSRRCAENNPIAAIRELVSRDKVCLALSDKDEIVPAGPMFLGADLGSGPGDDEEEGEPAPENNAIQLPGDGEGISHRVRNALALRQDLAESLKEKKHA